MHEGLYISRSKITWTRLLSFLIDVIQKWNFTETILFCFIAVMISQMKIHVRSTRIKKDLQNIINPTWISISYPLWFAFNYSNFFSVFFFIFTIIFKIMALQFKCNILGINKYIFIKYTTVNSLQKTDVKRLHGTVHLDQTGRVYNLTQSNSACRSKKCNQKYDNWQGFYLTNINLGICRALSPVVMHNKFWKY